MLKKDISHIIRCYQKSLSRGLKKYNESLTFNDKIKWLSIFDCTELKSICADKIKVKEYVANKIGKYISVPIIKIYKNLKELNVKNLPEKCILKCNHASGYNIKITDKNNINLHKIKLKFKKWLSTDYSLCCGELHYHWIKPKLFAEEYLSDNLFDYRFYCFNGNVLFMDVVDRSDPNHKIYNPYDLNFNPLYEMTKDIHDYTKFEKPKLLDKMIEYSKILSKEFTFVRVDFFYLNDTIYHSELTFTPLSGKVPYTEKYDKILGDKLRI